MLLDGEERLVYSVGDVATDPAVRALGGRRGVYRSMTELFYETVQERGVPFCFGFPNSRALEISNRFAATRPLLPVRERHVPSDSLPPGPRDASAGDFVGEAFGSLMNTLIAASESSVDRSNVRSSGVASATVTYLVSPAASWTSNRCESPTRV